MKNKTVYNSNNIGVFGFLGLIFITLKLCNVITWSWWWVTAPFWIPTVLCLILFIIYLIITGD